MAEKENRSKQFSRVSDLEVLLRELNTNLSGANEKYLDMMF